MLEIKDLVVNYGAVNALKGISLHVEQGQIVSLIGANGAGKTTLLHSISGLIKKSGGSIQFNGVDITNSDSKKIVESGLIQVAEGRKIFLEMTVYENLMMGAYLRNDKKQIAQDLEDIYQKFPRIKERLKQISQTLSGGELQMLAIARALMAKPKLLLLDEPSMGLSPLLVKEIFKIIKEINENNTTILLVEQNAKMALAISDYAYVLENGVISLEGKGSDLIKSEEVKKAYLGG